MNISLGEWFEQHPDVGFERHENGGIQVFSRDPEIWHLTDYKVDAALSGPSVWLRPESPGYSACRVYHPYTEAWAIHRDFSCEYLNRHGQWDCPMFCAHFSSRTEALQFARLHLPTHNP